MSAVLVRLHCLHKFTVEGWRMHIIKRTQIHSYPYHQTNSLFADTDDVDTLSLDDPDDVPDPHHLLCLHWPGSMVRLNATSDRADLDDKLATIAGADPKPN